MTNPFRKIRLFWGETTGELKKASWPNRTELRDSTIVVVIAIALLGAYVSLTDFSLFNVVDLFTSWVRPNS
jgi:preprotein translocase subunit SecE